MSLVFGSRDVSVGPTLGLDVSSSPAHVRDVAHDKQHAMVASRLSELLKDDDSAFPPYVIDHTVRDKQQQTAAVASCLSGLQKDCDSAPPVHDRDSAAQDKRQAVVGSCLSRFLIKDSDTALAAEDKEERVVVYRLPGLVESAESAAPARVRDLARDSQGCAAGFLKGKDEGNDGDRGGAKRQICEIGKGRSGNREDESESESSSIGVPDDSDDDDGAEEVQSKLSRGLTSLGSLEDSLPFKRGLSNHFAGRSKSFANVSDVSSVQELGKADNPFNKRRRTLLAYKWSKKSSFYSTPNPISMPLLALNEDQEQDDDYTDQQPPPPPPPPPEEEEQVLRQRRLRSCFSLTDLQHD